MSAPRKSYRIFLRPRSSTHHMLPEDWQNKVRQVAGLEVIGTSPRELQVAADEGVIAEVVKRVRAHCEVEEIIRA
ncbi:MAG: hypothetical protein RIF32_21330 [Leptospirales bacterium]|jgi:hypothetical protein